MHATRLIDLLRAMDGELITMPTHMRIRSVSTDTRSLEPGSLFFALPGDRFDGHDFLFQAFEKGAAAAVVQEDRLYVHPRRQELLDMVTERAGALFMADDSRRALGDAAGAYLRLLSPSVVAITGSSGKTSTRRFLETILSQQLRVLASAGNYNNDIGMPLTIFRLEREHELLLLEMGMNHAGELRRLAEIARPQIAVITNVGDAHLEFFHDRRAIAAAKKEIFSFFDDQCCAVLNRDDAFFDFLRQDVPGEVLAFGREPQGFAVAEDRGLHGYLLTYSKGQVSFPVGGEHNLYNLAAAVLVARKLGLSESVISRGIADIRAGEARSEIREGRCTLINDCYNANPDSMRSALTLLGRATGGKRIAVLGDMFELGEGAASLHRELGVWIATHQVCDQLVLIGPLMAQCADGAREAGYPAEQIRLCGENGPAAEWLRGRLQDGDRVLVKASRGMHLEDVVEVLAAAGCF